MNKRSQERDVWVRIGGDAGNAGSTTATTPPDTKPDDRAHTRNRQRKPWGPLLVIYLIGVLTGGGGVTGFAKYYSERPTARVSELNGLIRDHMALHGEPISAGCPTLKALCKKYEQAIADHPTLESDTFQEPGQSRDRTIRHTGSRTSERLSMTAQVNPVSSEVSRRIALQASTPVGGPQLGRSFEGPALGNAVAVGLEAGGSAESLQEVEAPSNPSLQAELGITTSESESLCDSGSGSEVNSDARPSKTVLAPRTTVWTDMRGISREVHTRPREGEGLDDFVVRDRRLVSALSAADRKD